MLEEALSTDKAPRRACKAFFIGYFALSVLLSIAPFAWRAWLLQNAPHTMDEQHIYRLSERGKIVYLNQQQDETLDILFFAGVGNWVTLIIAHRIFVRAKRLGHSQG